MTDEQKRFKDFGAGIVREDSPLSFKLHGEEFFCVNQIPGKVLIDLSTGGEDASMAIVGRFFGQVLKDESYERFEKLLEDKERIVSVETLAEIVAWLMEEYTSRPEAQSEDSSTGD